MNISDLQTQKHDSSEEFILRKMGLRAEPRHYSEHGFAHSYHSIAVFKGEMSCSSMLGNFGDHDLQGVAPSDFKINKIQVIDDDRQ